MNKDKALALKLVDSLLSEEGSIPVQTARSFSGVVGRGRPVQYRQFVSHGFLRVSRWDPERGEYVQIGSFAGPDANERAEQRIAADKAARK